MTEAATISAPTENSNEPASPSLERAIAQSKAEIAEAQIPKRKRGRPLGSGKKQKEAKAIGEAATANPSLDSAAASAVPQMDITPILGQAIKIPFNLAASKTRCAELALTDDEVKPTAELANQCLNAWAPALENQDPKIVLAISLAASVGMLAFAKYQIYADFQARELAKQSAPVSAEASVSVPTPTHEARSSGGAIVVETPPTSNVPRSPNLPAVMMPQFPYQKFGGARV